MLKNISLLKINMDKRGLIGINVGDKLVDYLAESMGCTKLSWPIKYLRVPLDGNQRSRTFSKGVEDKVAKHLESWSSGLFSLGERVTLINACHSSILLYYRYLFKIPPGIIERIEGRIRRFLSTGVADSIEII